MIAVRQLPQQPPPRQRATKRRRRRTHRVLRAPALRAIAFACAVLVPLLAYVALTANVTSLSFAIAGVEHRRVALQEQTQQLDDRIARLQSPERLAAVAARLGMHDPHEYAVVVMPAAAAPPRTTGFALLGWLKP